ncbi:MAG: stage IV sporulation protein A [Ruminococcaceae bacterium]|nr:stage IV sporulation protein A [Oscillospiraceae bacterium]
MTKHNIYKDISERTGGDIYIGVAGPVRTGKSTFIKRFMDSLVIPNIENEYSKQRANDELPQSAGGKTVMTTEPKFVPEEAVGITVGDNISLKVKLVDCVGYIVPEAIGHIENGEERLVNTPWSSEPMPFTKAAEIGTKKVIEEHSTIGIVVTTDATITEIPRQNYINAEERVIGELKEQGKPFAIVLNSASPEKAQSLALAHELEEKYKAPVALVNCLKLDCTDIESIISMILEEFPICEIGVNIPKWVLALEKDHWLVKEINDAVLYCARAVSKTGDIKKAFDPLLSNDYIEGVRIDNIDLGVGSAMLTLELDPFLYYKILSEMTGLELSSEEDMITTMIELATVKRKYDKIAQALMAVEESGYGIVTPDIEDLNFEEPEIIKQPNGYGVKLRANAPSLHIIRANIETEINPTVGTEQQSEDLIKYLLNEYEEDPKKIWESNIFGKSMYSLVSEGLNSKLDNMPLDAREKLADTLERIINEGSGGLICIIL